MSLKSTSKSFIVDNNHSIISPLCFQEKQKPRPEHSLEFRSGLSEIVDLKAIPSTR